MRERELARELRLRDAVTLGVGSMLGAGVFVVFGPAAAAAGAGLPIALVLAALIAWANADSSARLGAVLPTPAAHMPLAAIGWAPPGPCWPGSPS
jgi:basic amino acid/polyamine antiporter, APA family